MLRELRVTYSELRCQHEAWCRFCHRNTYVITDEQVYLVKRHRGQQTFHRIVPAKVAHFCRKLTLNPVIHKGRKPH